MESTKSSISVSKRVSVCDSFQYGDRQIHYVLDGDSSASGPIILFINDLLVHLRVWDPAVDVLLQRHPSWRTLRYDFCTVSSPTKPLTLSTLAADLRALLQHLNITTLHSIIGTGLGGSVALSFLQTVPNPTARGPLTVHSAVLCSVSLPFPKFARGPRAVYERWYKDRIPLARRVGMDITGAKAASRFFSDDARDGEEWTRVRVMVAAEGGGLAGMEALAPAAVESVGGLEDAAADGEGGANGTEHTAYRPMKTLTRCLANGMNVLFVCGAGDGMYPEEMEEYPHLLQQSIENGGGDGRKNGKVEYKAIPRTKRLACCERPLEFMQVLDDFWTEKA